MVKRNLNTSLLLLLIQEPVASCIPVSGSTYLGPYLCIWITFFHYTCNKHYCMNTDNNVAKTTQRLKCWPGWQTVPLSNSSKCFVHKLCAEVLIQHMKDRLGVKIYNVQKCQLYESQTSKGQGLPVISLNNITLPKVSTIGHICIHYIVLWVSQSAVTSHCLSHTQMLLMASHFIWHTFGLVSVNKKTEIICCRMGKKLPTY
jgi:hypothetical protein